MKFIFFEGDVETSKITMKDLYGKRSVRIICRDSAFSSKILSRLFVIHMSQKINRIVKLPLKRVWFRYLIGNNYSKDSKIVFVFIAGWFDKELFDWVRLNYPNGKLVLFLKDTFKVYADDIPSYRKYNLNNIFDLVLSYNPQDCYQYKFKYCPVFFSKLNEESLANLPISDIVFVGEAKDRLLLLHELYRKLVSYNLKCDFYITGVDHKDKKVHGQIMYADRYLPYHEYLRREVSSNCILEVIKGDTQGGTYRSWEAIYYNKKLITNWKGIKDSKYYDPRFILYFEKVEDIKIDFFLKNKVVRYEYKDENSPINLLKILETNLQG